MILAGRGFGKTWVGANYTNELAETVSRIALIAATAADARDTMIEGESGILRTAPAWFRPVYEPSKRRLTWPNGSEGMAYSAEESDRLRGPQFGFGWLDELAAMQNAQATWDMFQFGLRLANPRWLVTTTPRPIKLIKDLVTREDVRLVVGSTFENEANRAPPFLGAIRKRYEGTRLRRQERQTERIRPGGDGEPGKDRQSRTDRGAL